MVPREFGGYGGTFSEEMRVVILISADDSNIGQMYQLHTGGTRLLEEFASPEVQAKWLPRFASGELWITNAYSEIGTPSVNDFNTTVAKVDDGWLLNGTKFYCTGSLAGDITFGPCRVADSDEVRVFFTKTDADGVRIPGFLLLLGEWEGVHTWLVLAVIAGTIAVLLPIALLTTRSTAVERRPDAEVAVSVG
jgi:alkylation response protein AidB-like acyl-CoA dehydrogenase